MSTWWGQLFTQAVSFIAFAVILRIWAWGPVMALLDERRDRIRADLERAEATNREAEKRQADLNERLEKIEDEARQRVQAAIVEGRKAADEIIEKSREDAHAIRAHAKEMAEIELVKAMQEVKDDVVRMTITLSERLMREKMDDERHRAMVGRFMDELGKN